MRIYLASTHAGVTNAGRKKLIEVGRPKYILETFFNGEKQCEEALRDVGADNFLLDSGAFSFMSGAECSKELLWSYAERYRDFIISHGVKYYFELDVDTIYGIEFVEEIRKMLETSTGIKSIPVWHKGRGVDYWKKMVAQYDYIAMGGLVFHVKKQEWEHIRKMVEYAYRRGVRVHGLGFTKTRMLDDYKFWSVDSSSWTKAGARGQQRHKFNGKYIESHRIESNGKKVDLCRLVVNNGIEWCKYQRYMEGKAW